MSELLLRNVRVWPSSVETPPSDVLVSSGRIAAVMPSVSETADETIDGNGAILVPSFTDAHAHLDSTRLGLPFRPHTAAPGLAGLVANDMENWRSAERPVDQRAAHTLGVTIARGATRVRSHAQVDPDTGLERLEGVLAAREAHASRATVQVVAFPQAGILRAPGTASLLADAIDAGADLVGGLDPGGFDGDVAGHLDIVFGLAAEKSVGVDIHLHDSDASGASQIEEICRRALDFPQSVNISHCFGLTTVEPSRTAALVEMLAASEVSVTTVAPGTRQPLPLIDMIATGVTLGLGQDGIRDYWSPYGNGDMLDRTWQLAFTNGFRRDEHIEECVRVATAGGARVMGMGDVGVGVGDVADLVLIPADTVTSAVMDRNLDRTVIHEGRVVARNGELT